MRILLVGRNAQIGGGSTFRLNIGRGLRARGHHVAVAAMGGPMVGRYRERGLDFHWVPPWGIFAGRLAGIVKRERIDIVHASNTTAGDLALEACRRTGVPLVVSLHNTISNEEARHACLKAARQILVFDRGAAESAAKFPAQFDTSRIRRLPRPVEHRPVDPASISPLRMAYVGRLSSRKGRVALSLLEGFAAFARENPGASMAILGDGSMRREVARAGERLAAETGARIELHGPVLDPGAVLRDVGILIGAGYAALEAVMQGRAVIGAGFNGYGPVTRENVLEAIECNFGDTVGKWEMTKENFHAALRDGRAAWELPDGREERWGLDRTAAPIHGIAAVAEELEAVYQQAIGVTGTHR